MKILITGAGGFLGKALVRQMAARHQLYCIKRVGADDLPDGETISWIETDLSRGLDVSKLPDKLDAIIHLAQSSGYRNFLAEAADVFAINIRLVQDLCAYGLSAGISRMVLASSGTVYEPFAGPLSEDDPVRPTSHYGASKLSAELISESYCGQFVVCNLRVFFLYGPGQQNMLIARLIDGVRKGAKVTLPADGEGLVFVPTFVDDTARMVLLATEEGWSGVYNVASPHPASLGHLLRLISRETGRDLNLELTAGASPAPVIPSLEKLRTRTDLNAFLTPEQGIALSV